MMRKNLYIYIYIYFFLLWNIQYRLTMALYCIVLYGAYYTIIVIISVHCTPFLLLNISLKFMNFTAQAH